MALMFSRLAHNFIKNGYFPTDEVTMARIIGALALSGDSARIYDPCCGEGTALADIKHELTAANDGAKVQALGVDFNAERAWHAKRLLDVAVHSDMHDVVLSARSVGLLFLNPPYGAAQRDNAGTSGENVSKTRLEMVFLRETMHTLQFGGVLALVVPFYAVDEEMASLLAANFENLQFFMSPETRFKQCVILGVRRKHGHPPVAAIRHLLAGGRGELSERVLPERWSAKPYMIPTERADPDFTFHAIRIDAAQLAPEIDRLRATTLWPQFRQVFVQETKAHRPPLRELSKWHLALALAAGQITGTVRSIAGRTLYIKGDTFKTKAKSVDRVVADNGNVSETVTFTDRFVPVIRGIDMTEGPKLGQIVTIR